MMGVVEDHVRDSGHLAKLARCQIDAGIDDPGPALPRVQKFTFQDFNDLATKQNYNNLEKLYHSLIKQYPQLKISEGNLNNLGLQLVFNPEKSEMGISVFSLATTIYPESANLWDSLAEGYLFIGNKQNAIMNFEKSLELNPQNQNAINRLIELKK